MKYILKKEYPGSPKLGTIINDSKTTLGISYYENCKGFIENYPEFWELVVEKDYEILELSLQRSIKHQIVSALENSEDYTISLLSCNGNKIHSVKRLFDGEIFTIGDKIDFVINSNLRKDTIHKIKSIELNPNGIVFRAENSSWSNYLNEISKIKKPLFTTEDGLDIFEGMSFYYVCQELELYNTICCTDEKKYKNAKQFSTKEKAEEYILLNKPCLSYNEVLNATKIRNKNTFETLKNLVKSKIQQSV